jgi:hypothetical protein
VGASETAEALSKSWVAKPLPFRPHLGSDSRSRSTGVRGISPWATEIPPESQRTFIEALSGASNVFKR